jgi:hypothetical protein
MPGSLAATCEIEGAAPRSPPVLANVNHVQPGDRIQCIQNGYLSLYVTSCFGEACQSDVDSIPYTNFILYAQEGADLRRCIAECVKTPTLVEIQEPLASNNCDLLHRITLAEGFSSAAQSISASRRLVGPHLLILHRYAWRLADSSWSLRHHPTCRESRSLSCSVKLSRRTPNLSRRLNHVYPAPQHC